MFTGSRVVVEALLHHPVPAASRSSSLMIILLSPELLEMTVTSPGVLVQLQTFDVRCC